MKTVKAATLAILFLLIPHQEPRADTSQAPAPAPRPTERPSRPAIAETDGFVWSQAPRRDAGAVRTVAADHLATDGYSWSVRTDRALDSMR